MTTSCQALRQLAHVRRGPYIQTLGCTELLIAVSVTCSSRTWLVVLARWRQTSLAGNTDAPDSVPLAPPPSCSAMAGSADGELLGGVARELPSDWSYRSQLVDQCAAVLVLRCVMAL